MTDSVKKMEKVLKICKTFGIKTEIKFNPTKTQIMRINGTNQDETSLELCGEEIEWVRKLKYLGVWVDGKHYSKEHLRERRLSTWRAFYLLKTNLDICSKDISPKLKAHLFKTYVRPIMYYGLENCTINKNSNNGFAKRVLANDFTLRIFKSNETKNNRINKFISELKEIIGLDEPITKEILEDKIKQIKKEDKELSKN
ncbi:RNA-directed DNA polymerase from mobile element jockey-like [Brachionus plicatilis]|uniref:RNA-directed DNA polymerase from mobile element jockey-like n=1 Tax=Brachionus plicatilis TaxID=10195 RepID=A0A3M7T077_BRAPC|nr:RNA-directed DNA polymerase from mobile element jockey-like [Brachionus plicatilis]